MPKQVKQPLIETRKLKKFFPLKKKHIFQLKRLNVRANEDISLTIYKGETFGLVGESGCGKSTLGRVILQLYPPTSGSALYYGTTLRELKPHYVLNEIDKLVKYQHRAHVAYQMSLNVDKLALFVEKQIAKIDPEKSKQQLQDQIQLLNEQEKALKAQEVANVKAIIEAIKSDIAAFKDRIAKKPNMYVDSKWEQEANNIIHLLEDNDQNTTIPELIELLHMQHKPSSKAMKNLLKTREQLRAIQVKRSQVGVGRNWKKILRFLQERSKNLRKEASRQLREGSKTAGDFILEKDLQTIAQLMKEEELLRREQDYSKDKIKRLKSNDTNGIKAAENKANQEMQQLNSKLEKQTDPTKISEMKNRLAEIQTSLTQELARIQKNNEEDIVGLNKKVAKMEAKINEVERTLKGYHRKQVLPITERCLDPEYQDKMEKNREYGINLERLRRSEMRLLRQKLQIIFQDPYSSLNPRMTVGQAISEAVVEHGLYEEKSEALENYVVETMAKCGLDHYMIHRYPHQFSGGQRQRIVIARALALNPEFIVCDESVSALDVSIQSQILNLLQDLKEQHDLTYLFISHDLSVIKHVSDRIGVMYLGVMVELCAAEKLYENPLHPYSKALISAIPTTTQGKKERIILEGDIPSNIFPPSGCKFRTRCPLAREKCARVVPEFKEVEPDHFVACHFYEETKNIV